MHSKNGVHTLTLNPLASKTSNSPEALIIEQVHFFVELESSGEIWEIISPNQFSAERVVLGLIDRIPHLESAENWVLFNHNLELPLDPSLSLYDNELCNGELLGLIYVFTGY